MNTQQILNQQDTINGHTFGLPTSAHSAIRKSSRGDNEAMFQSINGNHQIVLNKNSELEFYGQSKPTDFNQLSPQQKIQTQTLKNSYRQNDLPTNPGSQLVSSFRKRSDIPISDISYTQNMMGMGDPNALINNSKKLMMISNGASFSQNQSVTYGQSKFRNQSARENKKPLTLKARMQQTIRDAHNFVQPALTKNELDELKKMNEKREMFTLLDKTSGPNNHLKYLSGRSRLVSAVAGGRLSTTLRSRSGSKVSNRIKSAQSRKSSSSGEPNFMKINKQKIKKLDEQQKQSLRLFQNYATTQSSKQLSGQLKQNYENIFRKNKSKKNINSKLIDPISESIQHKPESDIISNLLITSQNLPNIDEVKQMRTSSSKNRQKMSKSMNQNTKRVRQRIQSAQNFSRTYKKRQLMKNEIKEQINYTKRSKAGSKLNQTQNIAELFQNHLEQPKVNDLRNQSSLISNIQEQKIQTIDLSSIPHSQNQTTVNPQMINHSQISHNTGNIKIQSNLIDTEQDQQTIPSTQVQDFSTLQLPHSKNIEDINRTHVVQYSSISNGAPQLLVTDQKESQNIKVVHNLNQIETPGLTQLNDQSNLLNKTQEDMVEQKRKFSSTQPPLTPKDKKEEVLQEHFQQDQQFRTFNTNLQEIQVEKPSYNETHQEILSTQIENQIAQVTQSNQYDVNQMGGFMGAGESAPISKRNDINQLSKIKQQQFLSDNQYSYNQSQNITSVPSAQKLKNEKQSHATSKIKQVQDIYEVTANQSKASPHKAPQYRITDLKNNIAKVKNSTEEVRKRIEEIDNRHKKITNNTKSLKEQTVQCQADKLEVLRDLSQYEYNYSQQVQPYHINMQKLKQALVQRDKTPSSYSQSNTPDLVPYYPKQGNMKQRLSDLLQLVKDHRKMCKLTCEFDDVGNWYFTDKKHSYDFMKHNFNNMMQKGLQSLIRQKTKQLQKKHACGQKIQFNEFEVNETEESESAQEDDFINSRQKRWLFDSEMDHLMGCLMKLQDIKSKNQTTQDELMREIKEIRRKTRPDEQTPCNHGHHHHHHQVSEQQKSISPIPNSKNQKNDQTLSNQDSHKRTQSIVRPDQDSKQDTKSECSHQHLHHSNSKSLWSQATERKGHRAYSNSFKLYNSWEAEVKLKDDINVLRDTYDQSLQKNKIVCGLTCKIFVFLLNNSIEGQLSCQTTNQVFKFSMNPTSHREWAQKVTLYDELDRIYLEYEMNDYNSYDIKLNIYKRPILKDEYHLQNFIVNIQGSKNPFNQVQIIPNDILEEVRIIVTIWEMKQIKQAGDMQPCSSLITTVFNIKKLSHFLPDYQSLEKTYDLSSDRKLVPSSFNLYDYLKIIQEKMCIILIENKEIKLMLREEANEFQQTTVQQNLARLTNYKKSIETGVKSNSTKMTRKSIEDKMKLISPQPEKMIPITQDLSTPIDENDRASQQQQQKVLSDQEVIPDDNPSVQQINNQNTQQDQQENALSIISQIEANQQKLTAASLSARRFKKEVEIMKIEEDNADEKSEKVQDQIQQLNPASLVSPQNPPQEVVAEQMNQLEDEEAKVRKRSQSYAHKFTHNSMPEAVLNGLSDLDDKLITNSQFNHNNIVQKLENMHDILITPLDTEAYEKWQNLREEYYKRNEMLMLSDVDEDDDMENYDYLYGMKQVKALKKITQFQHNKHEKEEFEKQMEETQKDVVKHILIGLNQPPIYTKNRRNSIGQGKKKLKYFRQTQIYQNGYIKDIISENNLIDFHTQPDSEDKCYVILLMFYKENHQINLLLGREEQEVINSGTSIVKSIVQSQQNAKSSDMKDGEQKEIENEEQKEQQVNQSIEDSNFSSEEEILPEEKDDDSPFVLKIILDCDFLSLLEDPNLVEPAELIGPPSKMSEILENKKFMEIIHSEITYMYYKSKCAHNAHHHEEGSQKQAGAKIQIEKLTKNIQGSGARLSESDDYKQNKYEVINEENSQDSSNHQKKQKQDFTATHESFYDENQDINKEISKQTSFDNINNQNTFTSKQKLGPREKQSFTMVGMSGRNLLNVQTTLQEKSQSNYLNKDGSDAQFAQATAVIIKSGSNVNTKSTPHYEKNVNAQQVQQSPKNSSKARQSQFDVELPMEQELDNHILSFSVLLNRII